MGTSTRWSPGTKWLNPKPGGLASTLPGEMAASLVEELSEVRKAMAENDVVAVGYIQRNHIAFGLRRVVQHAAAVDAARRD